ncbi:MFS transporter [Sulfitobacter mediterraneus]|uniref:Major facilitator transporter n=1 Tax=Sulfitobacter mediterraneus TaxID=83219 RepID=A0A061SU75_9RHOB|nr:MFS transporter [Sulfitobacter mediterraneus]KAJ03228.1 major facilitator transporter [Sulfitobacter mediterraneus]MBM1309762.1 MFS transporter [Sulfitobacter mediterraneus]MBM1313647.1 MFS transporter [Sulfitobacter mediterraneus]MBM1322031.1 MFS transporter [Sulfitobacter mediterraneus]MBM1325918.1 MFS transporter [Sulfitobacter mediterraneus]
MLQVLSSAWALLLGMCLLMVGNGMQGTLLGIRGGIENFSTFEMSIVMSSYFVGFLGGSRMAPGMIRRVGHVRVFAALASLISAVMILYPTFPNVIVWSLGRVLIGFCFSAVYVTAESWLNNAATNENRGQALSLYMIVQTLGIVIAQALLLSADPSGFVLFVIPSVLVSIAVTPILLSITPTPAFDTTKPMRIRELVSYSPLGCVGMFLLGGVFSAQFGMASVYGAEAGLTVAQISLFVAMFFVGSVILQYPIGWISDRMDRRGLIVVVSLIGAGGSVLGMLLGHIFPLLLVSAFVVGGMSNPLYSLLIAHTNDFLEHEDMAAASGVLVFINGLGAILGPIITGWMMGTALGPGGFYLFTAGLFVALASYAAYRSTRRAGVPVDETGNYVAIYPSATTVAVEVAQEVAIEADQDDENDA